MFPYIIATVLPSGNTIAIPQHQAVIYPDPTSHRDQARQDLLDLQRGMSTDPNIVIPDFLGIPEEAKSSVVEIKSSIGKQHGDRVDQLVALISVEVVIDYLGTVYWLRDVRWDRTLDDVLKAGAETA